jgi:beta-ring hydroxylase
MGTGLIPADGEVWKTRRRAVVPALHRKYVTSMVGMFGDCALHGAARCVVLLGGARLQWPVGGRLF